MTTKERSCLARQESKVSSHNIPETISCTRTSAPKDYQRMTAEAAYYRALARGFQGGDPVEN